MKCFGTKLGLCTSIGNFFDKHKFFIWANTRTHTHKKPQQEKKQKQQQHIIAPVYVTGGDAIRQLR